MGFLQIFWVFSRFFFRFYALRVQIPPKKVFWGGFGGLSPFSGGTWSPRDGVFMCFLEFFCLGRIEIFLGVFFFFLVGGGG